MFILFTNLFLARPFRLENTLECYNLRGGQGGSTEVLKMDIFLGIFDNVFEKNFKNLLKVYIFLGIFRWLSNIFKRCLFPKCL